MASTTTSRSFGCAARQACTRFWPIKPAPPVIRTLCIAAFPVDSARTALNDTGISFGAQSAMAVARVIVVRIWTVNGAQPTIFRNVEQRLTFVRDHLAVVRQRTGPDQF